MALSDLLADITIDTIYVCVIQRHGVSAIHRTPFDGTTAQLTAACGKRAKGYWRIVPTEYNEARECLTCRRVVARITHGSKNNAKSGSL